MLRDQRRKGVKEAYVELRGSIFLFPLRKKKSHRVKEKKRKVKLNIGPL
jgi:hypothetical protein